MGAPKEIIIWDHDVVRIAAIDRNLHCALQKVGHRCRVLSMSEPPLLARKGVLHKAPVLEIDGMFWSLKQNEEISEDECHFLISWLCAL
ncbi:MAG: hypothetical protein KKC30_03950 [Proteobacteria bacterium]|nr:hypothetical protein [Pseudomonadota bacterium]MBU4383912.1 hypothetical protein [Pseudomonadota bacterium]MCG2763552.1 hypothetical protein [Desulfarculaceae bacterium]